MYRPRQWVLSFGCLFSDAMGTAAWARCEQVSKHCSKPLSTVGMDKDEASLLQADLKLHSKMHDQEDYTPSEESIHYHDNDHAGYGGRAHDLYSSQRGDDYLPESHDPHKKYGTAGNYWDNSNYNHGYGYDDYYGDQGSGNTLYYHDNDHAGYGGRAHDLDYYLKNMPDHSGNGNHSGTSYEPYTNRLNYYYQMYVPDQNGYDYGYAGGAGYHYGQRRHRDYSAQKYDYRNHDDNYYYSPQYRAGKYDHAEDQYGDYYGENMYGYDSYDNYGKKGYADDYHGPQYGAGEYDHAKDGYGNYNRYHHGPQDGAGEYDYDQDEKSKYDNYLGKRDQTRKHDGVSRADSYTRGTGKKGGNYGEETREYAYAKKDNVYAHAAYTKEKSKRGDDYGKDMSDYANDEDDSYAYAGDENSKYDNYLGKRDQTRKHDGKSRADSYTRGTGKKGGNYGEESREYAYAKKDNVYAHAAYTREKSKRGDYYGKDMSDCANDNDDSYAYAKDEKSKYDNYPRKSYQTEKHDDKSPVYSYTRATGKKGEDYGEDISDYAYAKKENAYAHAQDEDGKRRVATYTREKSKRGDDYRKDMSEYAHATEDDSYAYAKDEKSKYANHPGKRDRNKKHDGKSRADIYTRKTGKIGRDYGKDMSYYVSQDENSKYEIHRGKKQSDKGNYTEVRYGADYSVKTGDYAPAKEIEYKYEAYKAKHAKPWKNWLKWKKYFGRKGRIAKHRNLRTRHSWMQTHGGPFSVQ